MSRPCATWSVPRPDTLVFVTGTSTEVGKTWVAVRLAARLRVRGARVAARKPAQSFAAGQGPTDAELLAAATDENAEEVCPRHRWYVLAMAPPMAAEALGREALTIADLAAELRFPAGTDYGIVEGVGGPRSPLAADGDTVDLAAALRPDIVVLVADAGLGTINAVLLSAAALREWPLVVALNRFDPGDDLHAANRRWLADRAGLSVVADVEELADRVR